MATRRSALFAHALAALVVLAALVAGASGCSRAAPDATPEGVVRLWLEKMESAADDGRAMKDAYALLGPRARANLKERADRASRGQGRRYEPHEMLAEGRFGLRFRPKAMTAKIDGDDAWVEVKGDGPDQHATVKCTREGSAWRIEPDLPDVVTPARREGG
ncbi:MAG: hypothetical protein KF764_09995 [Labilithrix sp.]|nr:hypothetical protein [Labilithrix sp.]